MAEMISVHLDRLNGHHIQHAVDVLRDGGVIVYPTDTIYGLGCDITNQKAIERVQRIKGRDNKKPMSFVCADLTHISNYARVSNFAHHILKRCLPGAYTFVLPATRQTPHVLQTSQKTVGLRIPDHPVPLALVKALGQPILSTSANFSEQKVITEPWQLQDELGRHVDLIVECGALPVEASSVVSLVGDEATVLREGKGDLSPFEAAN